MGTGHRVCERSRNDTKATGCKSMLWHACMIHENRDLAMRDVKYSSERQLLPSHLNTYRFVLSFPIYAAFSLVSHAMLECFRVLRDVSGTYDLLIVRISGIPSLCCPRGRPVVSSASVKCNESGKHAIEEKRQLWYSVRIEIDSHCISPTPLCTPRS